MGAQGDFAEPLDEYVRERIPGAIRVLRRRPDMPRNLGDYLLTCQRPYAVLDRARSTLEDANMHRRLCDAVARFPELYGKVPGLVEVPDAEIYRSVAIWPHANKERPLTEISVVCRHPRRLYLFHISGSTKQEHADQKRELLKKAALFFYVNWGVESELQVVRGCKDAFHNTHVDVTYPVRHVNCFRGRL